jgi:hypothetical protein
VSLIGSGPGANRAVLPVEEVKALGLVQGSAAAKAAKEGSIEGSQDE